MGLAVCYDLHVYCDNDLPVYYGPNPIPPGFHLMGEFPFNYGKGMHNERECIAAARKAGWKIHMDGTAICPRCTMNKTPRSPFCDSAQPVVAGAYSLD